jgi:hypothetical protein
VRAAFTHQPIRQRQQILGACKPLLLKSFQHGAKLSNLSLPITAQPLQPTCRDGSLMDIQSTTSLVDHLHGLYPPSNASYPKTKGAFVLKRFSYACFPTSGATDRVSLEYSGPTLCRLEALDADRPPVIGLRPCDATIFMCCVVPTGT